jgi:hypothetical protein
MEYLTAATGLQLDEPAMAVWHDLLGNLPPEALAEAVKRYALTDKSGRRPMPALLIEMTNEVIHGRPLEHGAAWELVKRAIHVYGYPREPQALDSLPDDVRRAAERIGWQTICDWPKDATGVLTAQFRDIYNQVVETKTKEAAYRAAGLTTNLTKGIGEEPKQELNSNNRLTN